MTFKNETYDLCNKGKISAVRPWSYQRVCVIMGLYLHGIIKVVDSKQKQIWLTESIHYIMLWATYQCHLWIAINNIWPSRDFLGLDWSSLINQIPICSEHIPIVQLCMLHCFESKYLWENTNIWVLIWLSKCH